MLVFLVACANEPSNEPTDSEINIYLDGERLELDIPPIIINNRVMIPACIIFEALGAEIFWNESRQDIVVNIGDAPFGGGFQFRMRINEPNVNINFPVDGAVVTLDISPMMVDHFMFVPLQAISEPLREAREWCEELNAGINWREVYPALGTSVEWLAETNEILITTE